MPTTSLHIWCLSQYIVDLCCISKCGGGHLFIFSFFIDFVPEVYHSVYWHFVQYLGENVKGKREGGGWGCAVVLLFSCEANSETVLYCGVWTWPLLVGLLIEWDFTWYYRRWRTRGGWSALSKDKNTNIPTHVSLVISSNVVYLLFLVGLGTTCYLTLRLFFWMNTYVESMRCCFIGNDNTA